MSEERFELSRVAPPAPKAGAYANSATPTVIQILLHKIDKINLVNKKHPLIGVFFYIGRMPYFLSSLERYAFWHIFLASQNNLFKLSRRGLFGYTLVNRHFWVLPDLPACAENRHDSSYIKIYKKGGDPSTASATDALLRLRPCHRAYLETNKLALPVFPASLT